jgi:hypothetical protein
MVSVLVAAIDTVALLARQVEDVAVEAVVTNL